MIAALYLVRHGETTWNRQHRYLGHTDVRLSPQGRKQGERLARQLRTTSFQAILSSDLTRCLETARIIQQGLLSSVSTAIRVTGLLRELHFGDWEGKTYQQLSIQDQKRLTAWYQAPEITAPPGGETLKMLVEGLLDFIDYQRVKFPNAGDNGWQPMAGNILVVTHSG